MIRTAIDLLAIGAFIATLALWSGFACDRKPPPCKAGSVASIFTNCEVAQ